MRHPKKTDSDLEPSSSATRTDAEIAESVRRALLWDRIVPECRIRSTVADHGTVTLTGTVPLLAQRDAAERAVRNLEGVRHVVNELTVEAPSAAARALHATIRDALQRHVAREVGRIMVDVQGDTIMLSGPVESWRERRAILGAVNGLPWVRHVRDHLRLQG